MIGESDSITEQFERNRGYLRAVAYRMLGSVSDAEDAVQDAWLRVSADDPKSIADMKAWLTTVTSRVCLNQLRSRQRRREQLTDFHVPDPIVTLPDDNDPEREVVVTDSVGLALLVVLDRLSPAERVAFVLHDVFGVPFARIAPALDRSEAAAQQLASRARRRVRDAPEPDRDLSRQRAAVDAFFAAARDGDLDTLIAMLAPEIELRIDGGMQREDASLLLRGPDAVAEHTAVYSGLHPHLRPALVNGAAGVVVVPQGRLFSVMGFTVANGRIARIDALIDPERLARLQLHIT